MNSYKIIKNIKSICNNYDAFIINLFGIIHDETALLPNVIDCLKNLTENHKIIMFVVNSSERTIKINEFLNEIGLSPQNYSFLFSSCEETFNQLSLRCDPWYASLGNYCFYMGMHEDNDIIEDLGLYPVNDISKADFILAVGYDPKYLKTSYYDDVLQRSAEMKIPMICANPDEFRFYNGKKYLQAGFLAKQYERFGGYVRYHGKPLPCFYHQILIKLKRFSHDRIIVIGNSLENDVLGATLVGLDSLLITSGLQNNQFSLKYSNDRSKVMLDNLFEGFKLEPNYVLKRFKW